MSVPGNLVNTITMPLRWGDMDAYGHANNTVYFRFFEEPVLSGWPHWSWAVPRSRPVRLL